MDLGEGAGGTYFESNLGQHILFVLVSRANVAASKFRVILQHGPSCD